MEFLETLVGRIAELSAEYAPKFLLAVVTLIVGSFLIKRLMRLARNQFEKQNVDASLRPFVLSLSKVLLWAVLIISVAAMVGIETTSFIAVLGAAGLAIGLALQGSLGNFAGGVLILVFKPFEVGSVIEAQGFLGLVEKIQVFHTELKTFDNRVVIIPNGALANGPITNITRKEIRRCDMEFGVSYSDDIDKVKKLLRDIFDADKRILNEPAEPFIVLSSLGDSSVNFTVRVWLKAEHYWEVYFETHEKVKKLFDKEGVSIPFPQRDVHFFQADK